MKAETITSCFEDYLEVRGRTHYRQMTKDLIQLKPHIFPHDYTSKKTASILSHEITRDPNTRFVRLGGGYYTVR